MGKIVMTLLAPAVMLAASLVPGTAQTQSGAEACGAAGAPAEHIVAACTELIGSGKLSGQMLAVAYNNRGVGYFNEHLYDKAVADFTSAVRADPNYAQSYLDRAAAYTRSRSLDLAIADYTQALHLGPKLREAYVQRGLLYQNREQTDLAIADYTQALRLDPSTPMVYYYRALAYQTKGQNDLASADLKEALKLNPNLAPARGLLQSLSH